jgi:hypothetical protein
MESNYIKENIGPILTRALADIVLHAPHSQHVSSYSSLADPITLLGHYLLEHDRLSKNGVALSDRRDKLAAMVAGYAAKQQRERESRARMTVELGGRVAAVREALEKRAEPVEPAKVEKPNVVEAIKEEAAKEEVKEETKDEEVKDVAKDEGAEEAVKEEEPVVENN